MEVDRRKLKTDFEYRTKIFERLFVDHNEEIYNYCQHRLGDAEGMEIGQEVFMTAWEKLPKLQNWKQRRSWLFGIANRKCLQVWRNRARRAQIGNQKIKEIRDKLYPSSRSDRLEPLVEYLDDLAQFDRDLWHVIWLRYIQKLPVNEVATTLGVTRWTVGRRLKEAYRYLEERFNHDSDY